MPPHAYTRAPEPVVYVYLDWEAVSGSQPLSLGTGLLLGATWRHQGGAKHPREGCWVATFAGADQLLQRSVTSLYHLCIGHEAQQC